MGEERESVVVVRESTRGGRHSKEPRGGYPAQLWDLFEFGTQFVVVSGDADSFVNPNLHREAKSGQNLFLLRN